MKSMATIRLKTKLHLHICDSYIDELKAITQEYANIEVFSYRASCKFQGIKEPFETNEPSDAKSYILGGCSLNPTAIDSSYSLIQEKSCFYLFAPKTLIDSYMGQRAYLITSGWLKHWEYYIQEIWGFDESSAKSFFAEFCTKLILLDTLNDSEAHKHLEACAAFVGKSYEIVPVGLEYFKLYVENIIRSLKLGEIKEVYDSALQEKSNYAMAFDLLSRLNQKLDEREIINNILEIFTMLFAPQNIIYLAINQDKIIEEFSSYDYSKEHLQAYLQAKTNYQAFDDGFWIKLIYNDQIIGLVSIEGVAFKEYINPYLNLALFVSDLCALAIENARNYLKTKEIEAQLTQHAKLVAMGEMLSSIAHQWRQPLNTLNLNIEMLEDFYEAGKLDSSYLEQFIDKNTHTIQFLSQTITDFSNFFRIDKAKN
ncbi:MAG: DUF1638 domain-containing protein, partial [Campylobacterales bacterium]|nr:DUF1638 domain-containing protein [Campylobacterales bacterium]